MPRELLEESFDEAGERLWPVGCERDSKTATGADEVVIFQRGWDGFVHTISMNINVGSSR